MSPRNLHQTHTLQVCSRALQDWWVPLPYQRLSRASLSPPLQVVCSPPYPKSYKISLGLFGKYGCKYKRNGIPLTFITATSESIDSLVLDFFAGGSLPSSSSSMHSTSLAPQSPFVARIITAIYKSNKEGTKMIVTWGLLRRARFPKYPLVPYAWSIGCQRTLDLLIPPRLYLFIFDFIMF